MTIIVTIIIIISIIITVILIITVRKGFRVWFKVSGVSDLVKPSRLEPETRKGGDLRIRSTC